MSETAIIQNNMNSMGYFVKPRSNRTKEGQVRVALYARVSTQHEEQVNALEAQKIWLKSLCELHPNWKSVGLYVDEGLTGTIAKKRQGFMNMLEDAKNGKFDLIITREVCRFARNTVDSLNITRALADMNVEVFFFNDNIWSLDSDGELRLTIFSALAQEESRKVSERALAGQATSRQRGVLYGNGNIYAYKLIRGEKSVDNTYEIIPEEAENVRLIYQMYLRGMGKKAISRKIMELGKSGIGNKTVWSCGKIWNILRNKTYAGYKCYGKSVTSNYLTHNRIKNKDRSRYVYMKADFLPIISEEDWEEVQKIMDRMMRNPEKMVNKLVAVMEKNYVPDRSTRIHKEVTLVKKDMEQIEKRLENLLSGYLDGCIDITDYKDRKEKLEQSYQEMKEEYEFLVPTEESYERSLEEKKTSLEVVKDRMKELLNSEKTEADKKLVDKIVKKITPCPDSVVKWYLNFQRNKVEKEEDVLIESFLIHFEEAQAYRKKCGTYLRKSQWNDILVEVYIGV
ncbi:recombinase family protein [Anaerosporobacter sp.]